MTVKLFIECTTVRYAHKTDTLTVYYEPNGEIMPCQCCLQSCDLDKVHTHLMSDMFTSVIDLILMRK